MIEKKLLRLERMSPADKVAYWIGERPWDVDGVTLRLPFKSKKFPPGHVHMDGAGNIVKMPLLINRPCFGQVGAYLRHGGNQHTFNPRTGGYHPTRCARCPVKDACEFVCETRLASTDEIRELYAQWRQRGGREATWPKNGPTGSARVTLPQLVSAVSAARFTSDNDARVQEYYSEQIEKALRTDRERKRRERVRRALESADQPTFAPEVMEVLKSECLWRSKRYEAASKSPTAALALQRAKGRTRDFDSLVWIACKRIELRGERVNPSSAARELQQMGLGLDRSHNALRVKTKRSIERIALLEHMRQPGDASGGPVWPPFGRTDLKKALNRHTLQQQNNAGDEPPPSNTIRSEPSTPRRAALEPLP